MAEFEEYQHILILILYCSTSTMLQEKDMDITQNSFMKTAATGQVAETEIDRSQSIHKLRVVYGSSKNSQKRFLKMSMLCPVGMCLGLRPTRTAFENRPHPPNLLGTP